MHEVRQAQAGERIDKLLASLEPKRSRSVYQRWLRLGRVRVDGHVASPKSRLAAGQRIEVRPLPPPTSEAIPQDLPLEILHEDAHVVVINKAAGMVVHPAPGHPDGTLVNALVHRYGTLAGEAERPGIVHRLDAWTSGVMVVARTELAKEKLVAAFAAHTMERSYRAITLGRPPAQVKWDTLHGRHPHHRKRFSSTVSRGKRAVTHLARIEELHGAALVECRLETGRTHQIRVHCADHDFPLLSDPVYGRRLKDARLKEAAGYLNRQALHAAVLGFVHPATGDSLRFETELPEDFQRALEVLRLDA